MVLVTVLLLTLTPEERQSFGQLAAKQDQDGDLSTAPSCPFLSTLIPTVRCNKTSGVGSIRKFQQSPNSSAAPAASDKIVTVCPTRFLQPIAAGKTVFSWIAEKMLDIPGAIVVKETPFLRKVLDTRR